MKRFIQLDIFNYQNEKVCNLYDGDVDAQGQAHDIKITTNGNGWKELSFDLDSTVNKDEANYRLDFLKADYLIRAIDERDTDWFIISEPKITHNNFSKSISVVAGHISQLLKNKKLELEFSSEEGNNVGTPKEFLDIILDGTGWIAGDVAVFLENDGSIKRRTLEASAKSGAFKLITSVCALFDAKPVFHGDTKTVDILPLNPFSMTRIGEYWTPDEYHEGTPKMAGINNVLEMHYGKNVKGITKTVNTENMITKLYVYGNYGDYDTGLCNLRTCSHREYQFTLPRGTNIEYYFTDCGAKYYFNCSSDDGDVYIWSSIDPFSRSYVWCNAKEKFCKTYNKAKTQNPIELTAEVQIVQNSVPYLLNIEYYYNIGLMTDEQFKELIQYQRNIPHYYNVATQSSVDLSDLQETLDSVADCYAGMLRFEVSSYNTAAESFENNLVIHLNTYAGDNGVMYRSDFEEQKRNYFSWYVADQILDSGDSLSGLGSQVLIVHEKEHEEDPIRWELAYIKQINDYVDEQGNPTHYHYSLTDGEEPKKLILWLDKENVPRLKNTDKFYLFCNASIRGSMGTLLNEYETILQTIEQQTLRQNVRHPVFFINYDITDVRKEQLLNKFEEYAWAYRYTDNDNNIGTLYYNNKSNSPTTWRQVYYGDKLPTWSLSYAGTYFLDTSKSVLYCGGTEWIRITSEKSIDFLTTAFGRVLDLCHQRDRIFKGMFEKYTYAGDASQLPAGKYAYKTEYDEYWLFTLERQPKSSEEVWIDAQRYLLYIGDSTDYITQVNFALTENTIAPEVNLITEVTEGDINSSGVDVNATGVYRSKKVRVLEDEVYDYYLPSGCKAYLYDKELQFIQSINLTGSQFRTNKASGLVDGLDKYVAGAYYLRITVPSNTFDANIHYVRLAGYNISTHTHTKLIVSDKAYIILNNFVGSGKKYGLNDTVKEFTDVEAGIETAYTNLENAQNEIKKLENEISADLDNIIREGTWQDSNYVEGDEDRLYKDGYDNLLEISKPDTTYEISFLDLYGSNQEMNFGNLPITQKDWADIEASWAAHLIDEDMDIGLWGYIDKLVKAYDKTWETTVSVNTKLTLIGQHEFQDVMAHIVDVARETKAKQTLYKRAESLSAHGEMVANRIVGILDASVTSISSAASNWMTDENGNIVFNTADNRSAMMLTGAGLMIANTKDRDGKWIWRTAATGQGIVADSITSGTLLASTIETHSITTDKLSAAVGEELEIGSNTALTLFATIDGVRPAGSVDTNINPATTESYIKIAAEKQNESGEVVEPAHIDVVSGGKINLVGGSIDVKSNSNINVTSEGKLIVDSENFILDSSGNLEIKGKIITTDGKIANWNICQNRLDSGSGNTYVALDSGTANVDYAFWSGAEDASSAKFSVKRSGAIKSTEGQIGPWMIKPGYIAGNRASGNTESAVMYGVGIGDSTYAFWAGGPKDSTKSLENSKFYVKNDGTIKAEGTINLSAGSIAGWSIGSIYIGSSDTADKSKVGVASDTYSFWAGNNSAVNNTWSRANSNFYIKNDGTGKIGGWYAGANHFGDNETITSATVGMANTGNATDIIFWAGGTRSTSSAKFYVQRNGTVKASGEISSTSGNFQSATIQSGSIANWTISGNTLSSGSGANYVCIDSGTANVDCAFWAGATTASSAKFYIKRNGAFKAGALTVDAEGNASFTKGTINIADKFKVDANGNVTATGALTGTDVRLNGGNINLGGGTIQGDSGQLRLGNWYFTETGLKHNLSGAAYHFEIGSSAAQTAYCYGIYYDADSLNGALTFKASSYGGYAAYLTFNANPTYNGKAYLVGDICASFAFLEGGWVARDRDLYMYLQYSPGAVAEQGVHYHYSITNSRIQIKSFSDSYPLHIWAAEIHEPSSRSVKSNIKPLKSYGQIIDKLEPVSFTYKADKKNSTNFGLIYEDTINILPEICDEDETGDKSITYMQLIPILLSEIKSLRTRIKKLEGD